MRLWLAGSSQSSCHNQTDPLLIGLVGAVVRAQPPGKPSSRGFGCSGGNPLATWRTIAMISCTISPRAPPVALLSKYSTAARISALARPSGSQTPNRPDLTLTLPRVYAIADKAQTLVVLQDLRASARESGVATSMAVSAPIASHLVFGKRPFEILQYF